MPKPAYVRNGFPNDQLLFEGWAGNAATLDALVQRARLSDTTLKTLLGIGDSTLYKWRKGAPIPIAYVRLLAVIAGYLPWHEWKGWEIHNGYLFPPGYTRNGISCGDFWARVYEKQLLSEYKRQIDELQTRLRFLEELSTKTPSRPRRRRAHTR